MHVTRNRVKVQGKMMNQASAWIDTTAVLFKPDCRDSVMNIILVAATEETLKDIISSVEKQPCELDGISIGKTHMHIWQKVWRTELTGRVYKWVLHHVRKLRRWFIWE